MKDTDVIFLTARIYGGASDDTYTWATVGTEQGMIGTTHIHWILKKFCIIQSNLQNIYSKGDFRRIKSFAIRVVKAWKVTMCMICHMKMNHFDMANT